MFEYRSIIVENRKERLIDDISITVPDGAVLCLAGSDQRAKSLLLSMGAGNMRPDQGMVCLDGKDVAGGRKDLHSRIGYLSAGKGNYQDLTVAEYYEMILSLHKIRGRNRRTRIEEVLKDLLLTDFANRFINELPADLFPMFRLGKTILHEPDWLLLDQPFSGLDAEGRARIVTLLLELHEKGVSIILNAQMYPDLLGFITDIAVIEDGKLGISGQIEEVYENLLRLSPVTMTVLSNMDKALAVLKRNSLVDRVTVKEDDVIFRFRGEEKEEAELLKDLVEEGAMVQSYTRDRIRINEMFRG